jgi:hypothetical protein
MINVFLQDLLSPTFSQEEIQSIPTALRTKKIVLDVIPDIPNFIKDCIADSKNFKSAGAHRLNDWEKGWSGDGVYYSEDEYNNLPYYFKNNTHIRVNGLVYKDINGFAEVDLLRALQVIIFKKIAAKHPYSRVVEYGCGTGSNIKFLKEIFPSIEFYGSDWANSACENLIKNKILTKENVFKVNYFEESTFTSPNQEFLAFTNASLEQTGDKYEGFMNYLIKNPLCSGGIHIEPIRELLDLSNDLNKQSFIYAENRKYLTNFEKFMRSSGVDLILAKDFGLGSKFLSGYQVLCWKNKKLLRI